MRVEVRLRIVGEGGEVICDDVNVLAIDKHHDRLEAIGLSLDEGKAFLAGVQQHLVAVQAAAFAAGRGCCMLNLAIEVKERALIEAHIKTAARHRT